MIVDKDTSSVTNCVVAVCMGKNPMNQHENVSELFDYLCGHHKEILILVCDDIHKYEKMISRRKKFEVATLEALHDGKMLHDQLMMIRDTKTDWRDIQIARWNDIDSNTQYQKTLALVETHQQKYASEFAQSSEYYIKRRLQMATITPERLAYFTKYTIAELPVQLCGVNYKSQQYDLVYHPVYTLDISNEKYRKEYYSPIGNITELLRKDQTFMKELAEFSSHNAADLVRIFFEEENTLRRTE